jgi:hypothetical protein
MSLEEALDRAEPKRVTACSQCTTQLVDGDVWRLLKQRVDQTRLGFDPPGPPVTAQSLRLRATLLARERPPAADAGRTHAKTRTSSPMAQTARNRRQNPNAKIKGQSFRHVCRPPDPADSMNQISADLGIPNRFNQIGCRSSLAFDADGQGGDHMVVRHVYVGEKFSTVSA